MTQEHAYRTPMTNLELEELRKHNEKLLRENRRMRKVFDVGEYLRNSWKNSEVSLTLFLSVFITLVIAVPTLLLAAGVYRVDIVEAQAKAYAAARLQSSMVEVSCTNDGVPNASHFERCVARRNGRTNETVLFRCNEEQCRPYSWDE